MYLLLQNYSTIVIASILIYLCFLQCHCIYIFLTFLPHLFSLFLTFTSSNTSTILILLRFLLFPQLLSNCDLYFLSLTCQILFPYSCFHFPSSFFLSFLALASPPIALSFSLSLLSLPLPQLFLSLFPCSRLPFFSSFFPSSLTLVFHFLLFLSLFPYLGFPFFSSFFPSSLTLVFPSLALLSLFRYSFRKLHKNLKA